MNYISNQQIVIEQQDKKIEQLDKKIEQQDKKNEQLKKVLDNAEAMNFMDYRDHEYYFNCHLGIMMMNY